MNSPFRAALVLGAWLVLAGNAFAQTPAGSPASPFADDERTARIVERYKTMLAANPAEGLALDRLWKVYEEKNATAALLDQYQRLADAKTPAAALIYGHLLRRAGQFDEAAAAYARAAKLDPAGALPLVAQAELAESRGHHAEAAGFLEQALGKIPAGDRRRAEWSLRLGDLWSAAGDAAKASEAWERVVAADPANLAVRKQLAAAYERNGHADRAIGHYEYIDAHGDPAERAGALRELGRLHETRGEFDAARDALERGLAITARDNWLHAELERRLIGLYLRAGRGGELEARWKAEVEKTPRDLGGYFRLVALAEAEGDQPALRTWLEKVVALAPRDRESTLKLARLLADAGENDQAGAQYDKLLELQPDNLDLILARADLDLRAGRVNETTARIDARIAKNPTDDSVATPALAFLLARHLDDSAEKWLRATVTRQPAATEATIALAKFLFARRRSADAEKVLDDLGHRPGSPATQSARLAAIAECYKDANEPDRALHAWQDLLALEPKSPSALLASAELLFSHGEIDAGVDAAERALAAAPDDAARDEIDRKLFQALLDRSNAAPAPVTESFRWRSSVPALVFPPGPRPGRASPSSEIDSQARDLSKPLSRYLARLAGSARENPSVAAWLRFARWSRWAHHNRDATQAAEAVLNLAPQNIPARDILVDNAIDAHEHPVAIRRLREIAALDSARKPAIDERIASLLLEDNDFDSALALLDGVVKNAPTSVDALSALALAQQRADRWFDALATWECAYAVPRITPAQRANIRRPLLAAQEHLGRFQRAAELLQASIDAEQDLNTRQDLFRELLSLCQSHDLMPWLRQTYEARLASQPQDYFTLTALAELRKAAGETAEAYRLLGLAYYSSPEPAAALRNLVAEGENLGDLANAIANQRRLLALPGQAVPENLEKLAALEEANFDDDAAARTWENVVARFPRDTTALAAAADYFGRRQRVGRARELLAQSVALDPDDFARQCQLGQLDAQAGDFAGARRSFEAVLARTTPEKPGDPLVLPPLLDPGADPTEFLTAASRGTVPSRNRRDLLDPTAGEKDERSLRLTAIGELAQIIFTGDAKLNPDDRRRWLDTWKSAAAAGIRSEPMAAYYGAGDNPAVVALAASWMNTSAGDDAERAQRIFLLSGLRLGIYPELAKWVWSDTARADEDRPSRLVETLQFFLATGGRPTAGLTTGLFPPTIDSRALLWQIASGVFAEKRWFQPAIELGERALRLPGGNSAAESYVLAQWEVDMGQVDQARETLRRAIELGGGAAYDGTSGGSIFADLRAYYFLLPLDQRAAFADSYLQHAPARGPVHATLAAALLHGLRGDNDAARADLDRIVAMRPLDGRPGAEHWTPDQRRWNYLFACGTQLQTWNLGALAGYLWRRGLEGANAFDRRDPEVRNLLSEMRLHQLVAEVAAATDPQEATELVAEFLRHTPPTLTISLAASALVNAQQYPAAIHLYEVLCRTSPGDIEYPRALALAYEAAGDRARVDQVLAPLSDTPPLSANDAGKSEVVTRLAFSREGSGDIPGAIRLLLDARHNNPRNLVVLRSLRHLLERQGRPVDADAILHEESTLDHSAVTLEALAMAAVRRGDMDAAFGIARDSPSPDTEPEQNRWFARRVHLYTLTGHAHEAAELALRWVLDGHVGGVVEAVSELVAHSEGPAARKVLAEAIRRARDGAMRYQLQRADIETFGTGKDVPMDTFLRSLRQLEHAAGAAPGMRTQYVFDRFNFAVARGATDWIESELQRDWRDARGDIIAGEYLARLYFVTHDNDKLRRLVAAIDDRPNLPEQTLHYIASQLIEIGQASIALPMTDRLHKRFPQNPEYSILRARALHDAGKAEDADRVLEAMDAAGIFRDAPSVEAASLWTKFGETTRARAALEEIVARDPGGTRSVSARLHLAKIDFDAGRNDAGLILIESAYRQPSTMDVEPLVDALQVTGQLTVDADGDLPGGEMPLIPLRRAQLLAAICTRLSSNGHGDDAYRLALAHPEIIAEVPAVVESLARTATPAQYQPLAALCQKAIERSGAPNARLARTAAQMLVRIADWTPGQSGRLKAGTMTLLNRAHEMAPDDFEVARQLAVALRESGQAVRAGEVLRSWLAADALPTERQAARLILGQD